MPNDTPFNVVLIAEGSGGHLIPALEVAHRLAKLGARTQVWYAQRRTLAPLMNALIEDVADPAIECRPLDVLGGGTLLGRLWQCGQLWSKSQRCFDAFTPDVVIGFGGWISAPVVLAARQRRIPCLLHEQNVVLGRANRWLSRWVDRVAVSFPETTALLNGHPAVVTGMPVRERIGDSTRTRSVRFGLDPQRPTLLVLGGSQGSRALNTMMQGVAEQLAPGERQRWQVLHVAGAVDAQRLREAYASRHMTAWVGAFLSEMDAAYAQADVVLARAGASTIAELASCGKPAVLIPYPGAAGHQLVNARLVEAIGGGVVIEERRASPSRVLGVLRTLLADARLRQMMGGQMRELATPHAAERLTQAILALRPTAFIRGAR